MKRPFRPIFLAALCWLVVFLVPATRNGLFRAGEEAFSPRNAETGFDLIARFQREAVRRFPDNRSVQIDALAQSNGPLALNDKASKREFEAQARRFGDDPTVLALRLIARVQTLKFDRLEGPLSNPGGPGAALKKTLPVASSRAEWDEFIALARRGQKAEPGNTFFRWMVLCGLFATRRDDEARAELHSAARLSAYDDHSRDMLLARLETLRLVRGAPLSPADTLEAWGTNAFGAFGKMRQTARWAMECAIADRQAGRHQRALETAFDLAKMGRVMRRESYSLIGSLVGTAIQGIALSRTTMPPPLSSTRPRTRSPRIGAPLAAYQASPISLYAYAKSQNRRDITRFLDTEWPEIGKWRQLGPIITSNYAWTGNTEAQTLALTAAKRLRALILRALPSILLFGALFSLLARRFRDDSGADLSGLARGALASGLLLAFALILDAIITFRGDDGPGGLLNYLGSESLLSTSPSWVGFGLAIITISLATSAAIGWQKRQFRTQNSTRNSIQSGAQNSAQSRLQSAFAAPDDGLMRFDFGWLIGLIARATSWVLLLGSVLLWCWNASQLDPDNAILPTMPATAGTVLMGLASLISLALHFGAWRQLPRRRATLRLGLRLISQSLLGFFVAASLLYTLVSLSTLPLSLRFDLNFQSAMERGEVRIARDQLGL